MGHPAPNLARFLRRLHGRLFVVRLAEHAGAGVVMGAGLSLLVLPVLVMRGKPAMPVLGALLLIGALAGAAWLLLRRPRLIDTAGEADRQLGLADLLATGWMVVRGGGSVDDPFERAVLAVADARAAELSPGSVVLNRFGARAWTGIGLTTALAMTLAMLSANPVVTQADAERGGTVRQSASAKLREKPGEVASSAAGSRAAPIVADHPSQEEGGFNPARRTTTSVREAGDSSEGVEAADPSGLGGGAGTSRARSDARHLDAVASGGNVSNGGVAAGGGGGAGSARKAGDRRSGMASGAGTGGRAVPPWAANTWEARRAEAGNAVRSGALPVRYHDLVRGYFDREAGQQ